MPVRKMKFPQDVERVGEISLASFQYAEHTQWGIQEDEAAGVLDQAKAIKRTYPLMRLGMLFAPGLRELLMGYVWEEDGEIVGTVMFQRRGEGKTYYINDVTVLPEYRRRGIARSLVEAVLEDIRGRGGRKVLLEVIAGNLPAYRLYEQLGWEYFSGSVHLNLGASLKTNLPAGLPLPAGVEVVEITGADWQADFDFSRRVTPQKVQQYDPLEEARFRASAPMRLWDALNGVQRDRVGLRTVEGKMSAVCAYRCRTKPGGVNQARLLMDPACVEAAPFFIGYITRRVQELAPGRRLEIIAPSWLPEVTAAALQMGYNRRYEQHSMGLLLG